MRLRRGGTWQRRQRARGCLVVCWLAASSALAQTPLPSGVALSVERCASLPFDVDAYVRALEVELMVLNAQPVAPGVTRELTVRTPGCDDEVQVSLKVREDEASETL